LTEEEKLKLFDGFLSRYHESVRKAEKLIEKVGMNVQDFPRTENWGYTKGEQQQEEPRAADPLEPVDPLERLMKTLDRSK
jgi:hypothetical protein